MSWSFSKCLLRHFFLVEQRQAAISIFLRTVSPVVARGSWNSSINRGQSQFCLCDWRHSCLSGSWGLCRISELPTVVQRAQDPDCVVRMKVMVLSLLSCPKHSVYLFIYFLNMFIFYYIFYMEHFKKENHYNNSNAWMIQIHTAIPGFNKYPL